MKLQLRTSISWKRLIVHLAVLLLFSVGWVGGARAGGFTTIDDTSIDALADNRAGDKTLVLADKTAYTFKQASVSYTAKSIMPRDFKNGPALSVEENATVILYIPKGQTLSLTGTSGESSKPGAPAICVPPSSTLIITGEGTLKVRGGNAGNGDGGQSCPQNSYVHGSLRYVQGYAGNSGAGGAGGGGAAPGIGGIGGKGGSAGSGRTTKEHELFEDSSTALQASWECGMLEGRSGGNAGQGETSGQVYVLGSVKVESICGDNGQPGSAGENYGEDDAEYQIDDVFVGGSAPGGGGGAGEMPNYVIGNGGPGGGGGGGGSTGSIVLIDSYRETKDGRNGNWPELVVWGRPGGGGLSASGKLNGRRNGKCQYPYDGGGYYMNWSWTARECEKDTNYDNQLQHIDAPAGGRGGNAGQHHDNDAPRVKCSGKASVSAPCRCEVIKEMPEAIHYKLHLVNGTYDKVDLDAYLLEVWPAVAIPRQNGYRFMGYYTGLQGRGERVLDERGRLLRTDTRWKEFSDLTLYAKWEFTGRINNDDPVVIDSGELVVDETKGTVDGWGQCFNDYLFKVAVGARLVLCNLEIHGTAQAKCGVIWNEGEVVVSNCTFTGCTADYGVGAVYSDAPGARATFDRCYFADNSARQGGCFFADGSTVSILYSTFVNNYALDTDSSGGTIACAFDGARFNFVSCTAFTNRLDEISTASYPFRFGNLDDKSAVLNSLFVANRADGTDGADKWMDAAAMAVVSSHNVFTNSADGVLGPERTRKFTGVAQKAYPPIGKARTDGCATELWQSLDGTRYGIGGKPADAAWVLADQFGEYPLAGRAGARTGNTLQHWIDIANAGDTIFVPTDEYEPVVVDKEVHLMGDADARPLVDANGMEPCVIMKSGAKKAGWSNFLFGRGRGEEGGGIAWTDTSSPGGYATNCYFALNVAKYGGAVSRLASVSGCTFSNNTATASGGASANCEFVHRCRYARNTAIQGGASYKDNLYACLLTDNKAYGEGGGAFWDTLYNCTLARNTAVSNGMAAAGYSLLYASFVFPKNVQAFDETVTLYDTHQVERSIFLDESNDDFHMKVLAYSTYSGKWTRVDQSKWRVSHLTAIESVRGLDDLAGNPLLIGLDFGGDSVVESLYPGCYAYSEYKVCGLEVTGTDDYYRNDAYQTSLREAIEEAARVPGYRNADGEFVVTFSPELCAIGEVTFPSDSFQIDIAGFTNSTLVVRGPTNAVITFSGGRSQRGFSVAAGNRVRFENLAFTDFIGAVSLGGTSDGPAIYNLGSVVVSNCVFSDSIASPDLKRIIGYGGAVYTADKADTTVFNSSFYNCTAARGGALATSGTGTTHAFFTTFVENSARDAGGAIAHAPGAKEATTLLVNCTVGRNAVTASTAAHAGGGIAVKQGLTLLNTVVLGNRSGEEEDDVAIEAGGSANFVNSAYGTRTEPSDSLWGGVAYEDEQSFHVTNVLKVIAYTNATLAQTSGMHWQHVLPLTDEGVEALVSAQVWANNDLSIVGYGDTVDPECVIYGSGSPATLKRRGQRLYGEQLGSFVTNSIIGAVVLTGRPPNTSTTDMNETWNVVDVDDPGDAAVSNAVVIITHSDGTATAYASAEEAAEAFTFGDTLVTTEKGRQDDKVLDILYDEVYLKKIKKVTSPWLVCSFDYETGRVDVRLNESKTEELRPMTDTAQLTVAGGRISVSGVGNAKADLWYALAVSPTLGGSYLILDDSWVRATADGSVNLNTETYAQSTGFFKLVVSATKSSGEVK